MSATRIDLSIIIPAYNEAARIGDSLETLATFLATRKFGIVEVLVVTADSPDGTAAIVRSKAKLFEHFNFIEPGPRVGKGRDVRVGMFEAKGRYKLFMDADLATPLIHLDDVQAFIERRGKVAIAVRDLLIIHEGILRKVISKAANIAAQALVVPGIKDTQCGFKVFDSDAAEAIFSRMTMQQWSFDMEILAITRQLHYPIEYIETPDWQDPKVQGSGLVGDSQLKIVFNGFLDPFKIRLNILTGRYHSPNYTHVRSY